MQALDILDRLIAFDTSGEAGTDVLADWAAGLLHAQGIALRRVPGIAPGRSQLFAATGSGGLLLSAHADTVPAGDGWTRPPFRLTRDAGRLFGRGTADMKGFVALALEAMVLAAKAGLPLALALSSDEEKGCLGAPALAAAIAGAGYRPQAILVGEPTLLKAGLGHKGKLALLAEATGEAAHSAEAPYHVNALHLAADMMALVRAEQERAQKQGPFHPGFDPGYSTIHAARLSGGAALNVVPAEAKLWFEIRHLPGDDPAPRLARLREGAAALEAAARRTSPAAALTIRETMSYPGHDTPESGAFAARLAGLAGQGFTHLAFGTEAGIFAAAFQTETIILGPGSMEQGHRPDEFISESQFLAGRNLLAGLGGWTLPA